MSQGMAAPVVVHQPRPARRVLQLIQEPQYRGAEVFALELSAALPAAGWESRMASLYPGDHRFIRRGTGEGIWLGVLSPARPGGILHWPTLRRLRALLGQTACDVVQANGADTLKYLALARPAPPVRLVYRSIGMPSFWRHDPLRRSLYRFLVRRVDMVVAVCRRAEEELVRGGLPASRVVTIPNGVAAGRFVVLGRRVRQEVRAARGVAPDEVVVIHIGSLTREKNHPVLVRVLARLRSQGVPARLWFVGDGPERPSVVREARAAGVEQDVWFAGTREDVPALLAAADIFALPSRTEGMPAALIEAGLSALPAVAYDVGGIGEVVAHERTGFVVPPGDESAFQAAVARLAQDLALRARMGATARDVCGRFEITRVAAQYAKLYAALAG